MGVAFEPACCERVSISAPYKKKTYRVKWSVQLRYSRMLCFPSREVPVRNEWLMPRLQRLSALSQNNIFYPAKCNDPTDKVFEEVYLYLLIHLFIFLQFRKKKQNPAVWPLTRCRLCHCNIWFLLLSPEEVTTVFVSAVRMLRLILARRLWSDINKSLTPEPSLWIVLAKMTINISPVLSSVK